MFLSWLLSYVYAQKKLVRLDLGIMNPVRTLYNRLPQNQYSCSEKIMFLQVFWLLKQCKTPFFFFGKKIFFKKNLNEFNNFYLLCVRRIPVFEISVKKLRYSSLVWQHWIFKCMCNFSCSIWNMQKKSTLRLRGIRKLEGEWNRIAQNFMDTNYNYCNWKRTHNWTMKLADSSSNIPFKL